jgi:hypothetical protein
LLGRRPLKRWRYVGIFCEQLMACAAIVQVGIARQVFWAIYLRPGDDLLERTRMLPRGRSSVKLSSGRLDVRERGVTLEVSLREEEGIRALCRHGDAQVWTRKQAGIPAEGRLLLAGRAPFTFKALAVIDDTAGHHARRTEWWWAAGVGHAPDGTALAFNLVQGVNDPPNGSERAIWVAGEPHEAAPVRFAADLSEITAQDGSRLRFSAEAQRSRRENLILLRSDYRAPFGTFSGTLPGGIELSHGLGVSEHHTASW